jgi:uncharacterized RDD family membrane protein YckC
MNVRFAGFWIRFVANVIDGMLLTLGAWLLEVVLTGAFYLVWSKLKAQGGESVPPYSDAFNQFWLQIFNMGLYLCLAFPYYVIGHFKWGTTLGKRPFRIYVVDAKDLKPISMSQSVKRFCSYLLSYVVFAAGYVMAAFHPQKRALHDLIAGTVSVRREKAPAAASALTSPSVVYPPGT